MENTQIKKLKLNATNISSSLFRYNKELIKLKKDRVKLYQNQQSKSKVLKKEKGIESSFKQSVQNIGQKLISKPLSLIDKFKEFFGLILLGILVNNLPKIIKGLQDVLKKIKSFLDKNPWIMDAVKFGFKIVGDGIMGLVKLIKEIKPYIGGSFKFALDTIRVVKNQVGTLIKTFDELDNAANGLIKFFGLDKPEPKPPGGQRNYGRNYKAEEQKAFRQAAQQTAKRTPTQRQNTLKGSSYNPDSGRTYNPAYGFSGVLAPKKGVMGTMEPGKPDTWRRYSPDITGPYVSGMNEDRNLYKQNVERYKTLKGYAKGGTVRGGLGNIPPQEGTFRGGPSDISKISPSLLNESFSRTPFTSPGGTAKGRKARESINAFKIFEMNVKKESLNLENQEKNYDLFGEFLSSYKILSDLRKKYGDTNLQTPSDEIPLSPQEILEYDVKGGDLPSVYPGRGEEHGYKARDYAIAKGKAITVFKPGTVVEAGNIDPSGYGNTVVIDHGDGMQTLYGHLSKINVNVGDVIKENEKRVIGLTGGKPGDPGSGRTTGEHLHFEVRRNGKRVTGYNDGDAYFRFGTVVGVRKRSQQELDKLINKNLVPTGQKLTGEISWYGPGFYGNRTASGKPFTPKSYVAAHRTLPFGTMLRITWNGKTITVPVEDRGPYAPGSSENNLVPHPTRTIDLSEAAAKDLGMIGSGVISGAKIDVMKIDTSKKADAPERKILTSNLQSDISNIMSRLRLPSFTYGNYEIKRKPNGELDVRDKGGNFGNILKGGLYSVFGGNVDVTGNNEKLLQQIKTKLEDVLNKESSKGDFGGVSNNDEVSTTNIIKETVIAMVPGPPQTVPVPVDRLVPVPMSTENNYNEAFYSV